MKYQVVDPEEHGEYVANSHREAMLKAVREIFGDVGGYVNAIPSNHEPYHESEDFTITDENGKIEIYVYCEWDEGLVYYWKTKGDSCV